MPQRKPDGRENDGREHCSPETPRGEDGDQRRRDQPTRGELLDRQRAGEREEARYMEERLAECPSWRAALRRQASRQRSERERERLEQGSSPRPTP